MPGGYTHVTLAQLAIQEAKLRDGLLHDDAKRALGKWKKFCIVGAISPDYPYLDVINSHSAAWADAMHEGYSLPFLRQGINKIRGMADDNLRQKCMAWLYGFASHIAADGTIHPIVNLKVGPYEQNKTAHRRCEMSQDVYAHSKLNMGKLDFNQQISTNVNDTSDINDQDRMDADVAQLWNSLLVDVYSSTNTQLQPPKIHAWHEAMRRMMKIGEDGEKLIPYARHVAANQGLVYPDTPDGQYLNQLAAPDGTTLDIEAIFQKALNNILEFWSWLSLSLQNKASPLDTQLSWSLDTGIDEKNRMTYWS
jgi:hypothetical protein